MTKNYIIPAKNKPKVTVTTPCREMEEKYGTYYDDENEIVDYSYVDRIIVRLKVLSKAVPVCEYVDVVPRNIANNNDTLLDYFKEGFKITDVDPDCYDISVTFTDPIDSCVQLVSTYIDGQYIERVVGIKYTAEDADGCDTDYFLTVKSFDISDKSLDVSDKSLDVSDEDYTKYIEYLTTLLTTLPDHWECPEFENPMETVCEWDTEF